MNNLSEFCPNISSLKLAHPACYNKFYAINWCSSITGFRNLEKLEMGIYFTQVSRYYASDYNIYQDMIQTFLDNPMEKMREFKLDTINAFFQDEFLVHLPEIFPNLEKFNFANLGLQGESDKNNVATKYSYWRFDNILHVLRSLGSVKNLTLPSMEMVLSSWNDTDEHDQSIRETGRVFHEALQIIKNQFPVSLGDLRITDEKFGYVVLKEKMKNPIMFNQMKANDRPVKDIVHDEKTKNVHLKLKPKRKKSRRRNETNENLEEIVLSDELIKTLYKKYVAKSS